MLCQFQVYSKVIKLYIYPFFFNFLSHLGCLHNVECYTAVPYCLSVLSRVACTCQSQTLNVNNAAVDILFLQTHVFISQCMPKSGTAKLFPSVAASSYSSTSKVPRFQFLQIFANTCLFFVFLNSHAGGKEGVFHYGQDLHISSDEY